jgi:hypothetical protein
LCKSFMCFQIYSPIRNLKSILLTVLYMDSFQSTLDTVRINTIINKDMWDVNF